MKRADISIELVNKIDKYPFKVCSNAGDVQIANLKDLKDYLLYEGWNIFAKIRNIMTSLIHNATLLSVCMFYF